MDYKPNPELEKLKAEKEKNEKEIEQLDHKITRLENRQKYYEDGERKRRTHRLCTIAGTLESIAPEIKELDITEVMELLEAEVIALKQEIEVQERQNENVERFVRTADKYVDIEEIDPCMLRELIKAIYVEAPDKSSGKRRQNIHIEYDGIGFIPLDELAKKETA